MPLHVVLCATGYNLRWLLRAILRLGLTPLSAPGLTGDDGALQRRSVTSQFEQSEFLAGWDAWMSFAGPTI
jgi:hypothetical protein